MPDEGVAAVRSAIIQVLRDAPEQRLQGAVLGNRFRSKTGRPLKDYGYKTLSDFVKENMLEKVSVEHGGVDLIFQLTEAGASSPRGETDVQPSDQGASATNLFRLWKSPRSRYKLAVRKSDGTARELSPTAAPNDNEIVLALPSAEQHMEIARRFLSEHVPEEHREEFASKIDPQNAFWWKDWDKLFRERLPDAWGTWLDFRTSRLLNILDDALKEAGLSEDARARALRMVRESRGSGRAPLTSKAGDSARAPGRTFRQLVVSAIDRMSDEDLRRLWLPAGVLYDIFRANRSGT
jgi:hypothetical protein